MMKMPTRFRIPHNFCLRSAFGTFHTFYGHAGNVVKVEWSPDGSFRVSTPRSLPDTPVIWASPPKCINTGIVFHAYAHC